MIAIVDIVYLTLMFIVFYILSFFIILTFRHRKDIFNYPKSSRKFSVSVLVPAYNEEDSIAETIKHVCESNYPGGKLEVIVINDGSGDRTLEIARSFQKKYANLKIINKKNTGKADSLNAGIKIAKGDLIAVVDSDSFPEKDSIRKLTGYFANPKMGAVTSFVSIRNKSVNFLTKTQGLEYVVLAWTRKLLDYINSVFVTNGPLSMYRKSIVKEVGGFDRNTVTEDIELTWNILYHGYQTSMCLDARVSTIGPEKFKSWYNQRARWGVGGLQAIAKYKGMFFRRGMFGVFVLPFFSLGILLALVTIVFSAFVISKRIFSSLAFLFYAISSEAPLINLSVINFNPTILLFYYIGIFSAAFVFSWSILKFTKHEKKLTIRKFFNIVFYSTIYIAMYSLIWFPAIYRYMRRDFRW